VVRTPDLGDVVVIAGGSSAGTEVWNPTGGDVRKPLTSSLTLRINKLEYLSPSQTRLFNLVGLAGVKMSRQNIGLLHSKAFPCKY
jgi:hypothetical protein